MHRRKNMCTMHSNHQESSCHTVWRCCDREYWISGFSTDLEGSMAVLTSSLDWMARHLFVSDLIMASPITSQLVSAEARLIKNWMDLLNTVQFIRQPDRKLYRFH